MNPYLFFSVRFSSIDIYEHAEKRSRTWRSKHTHTRSAVHKLIMHGAHLVHMQTFGRHVMSVCDEPRGTHHF